MVVVLATAVLAEAIVVVALLHHVGPFRPAFTGKVMQLASIALLNFMVHFTLCIESNLFNLMAAIIASFIHVS
jgi:hypothetical protein